MHLGKVALNVPALKRSDIFFKERVQTNKDLGIPTQQELLAQFGCDEISVGALTEFSDQVKSQKPPIEAGNVIGFGIIVPSAHKPSVCDYFVHCMCVRRVDDVPQHDTIVTRLGTIKKSTSESAPISLKHST